MKISSGSGSDRNESPENPTEYQLISLVESAPFPIGVYIGDELRIRLANKSLLNAWGKGNDVIGKTFTEILPELEHTGIFSQLRSVLNTGIPYNAKNTRVDLMVDGKLQPFFFNYSFTPLHDIAGNIYGVMNTAADVTDLAEAKQKIENNEYRYRQAIEESPFPTCVFVGPELTIEVANQKMIKVWGKGDSVLGKTVWEALPELEGQPFIPLLEQVYQTGETYNAKDAEAKLMVDGKLQLFYFDFTYKALRDENGVIYGVMDVALDVTDKVIARKKLEDSEQKFKNLVIHAPIGICIVRRNPVIAEIVNDKFLEVVGKSREEMESKPYWEVNREAAAIYEPMMQRVFETNIPYIAEEHKVFLIRNGVEEFIYANFVYQPLKNENGEIDRVMVLVIEVTSQVIARQKIEQSEQRFRSLIAAAPMAIGVFMGRDLVIETHNKTFENIIGKGNDIIGKKLIEAMPELVTENQPFLKILDDVYTTGISFQSLRTQVKVVRSGVMTTNYYDITYTPLFDENGDVYAILNVAIDVTESAVAQKKIEESEKNLRNTILQAPVAMCILRGRKHIVDIANERMLVLWGKAPQQILNLPVMEGIPELEGQGFDVLLDDVFSTGNTFRAYEVLVQLARESGLENVYVNFVYEAFREADGEITGIMAVAHDVTQQVLARKKIEEAQEKARLAIESADLGTYETNLFTGELTASDRFRTIWGIAPDIAINRALVASRIHPADSEIRNAAHHEALVTGNVNYEARVIHPDNSIHWVRVKGKIVINQDGDPEAILGIIQDISEQKEFAEQLTRLVRERTIELQRSNEDLLQFAHVASHDLKEPVRKIKFFSSMLQDDYGELLPERGRMHLKKVQTSTDRMFSMIEGVLSYSTISSAEQPAAKVNLNETIKNIEIDLEVLIAQKQCSIHKEGLPIVEGANVLLYQLFYNIINNSLKFSKPELPAIIQIAASQFESGGIEWTKITISDNGIGLDPNYSGKIFNAFARLNSKDKYEGTGLGLALCKKIVERHHGTIEATGVSNESATFTIVLPLKQSKAI